MGGSPFWEVAALHGSLFIFRLIFVLRVWPSLLPIRGDTTVTERDAHILATNLMPRVYLFYTSKRPLRVTEYKRNLSRQGKILTVPRIESATNETGEPHLGLNQSANEVALPRRGSYGRLAHQGSRELWEARPSGKSLYCKKLQTFLLSRDRGPCIKRRSLLWPLT